MSINHLRLTATTGAKFSALLLLLMLVTGCNGRPNNPAAGEPSTISTTESAETDTAAVEPAETNVAKTELVTAQSDIVASNPADPPQGEPGYIGYPFMGETTSGDLVYYITSESITCIDGNQGCVLVHFIQVDANDANQTADGRAVAQCYRYALTEVMLDESLVAYEIASPDGAMFELLNTACQAHRPGELTVGNTLEAPEGLVEGMPYGEVRSRIIDDGWVPKRVTKDHYTPLEQELYDRGYTEIGGCSGMGLCFFEYDHSDPSALADGKVLLVATSFADSDVFFEEDPLFNAVNIGFEPTK